MGSGCKISRAKGETGRHTGETEWGRETHRDNAGTERDTEAETGRDRPREGGETESQGAGDGDGQRRGVVVCLGGLSQTAWALVLYGHSGSWGGEGPAGDRRPDWVCKELWGITLRLQGA